MSYGAGSGRGAGPGGRRVRHGLSGPGKRARTGGTRLWSEAAEEAFFRELESTRNVRASAEATGFSAGTVYALRRARPDFAARWRAVLALRRRPSPAAGHPARRPSGCIVRYAAKGRAKRVRCHVQWSDEIEEVFLDALAASCNVTLACAEAGVGHSSVYRQRRTRPDFAAKWQAALEQGYARLEMALVEAAAGSFDDASFDAERPVPRMSPETALKVLQAHRAAVTGSGRTPGWKAPRRGVEHYRESILRKIEAIKRARRAKAEGEGGGGDGR
jgi:hypothetical protein